MRWNHLDEISADENITPTFIYTSTPKKRKFQCGGCIKQSQSENCYLDDYADGQVMDRPRTGCSMLLFTC